MGRTIRDPGSKARIVEAARRVVAERGLQGATIRAIASETGVSTGFVTHYFADKDELLRAVVDANNRRALNRVIAAIGEKRGLAALEAAAEAVLPVDRDRRSEWQVWVAGWGPATYGDELAAAFSGGWNGLRSLIAGLLEQAEGDGEIPAGLDLEHEADRILTVVAGLGLISGVEAPKRVRLRAQRMLADQLSELQARDRSQVAI